MNSFNSIHKEYKLILAAFISIENGKLFLIQDQMQQKLLHPFHIFPRTKNIQMSKIFKNIFMLVYSTKKTKLFFIKVMKQMLAQNILTYLGN